MASAWQFVTNRFLVSDAKLGFVSNIPSIPAPARSPSDEKVAPPGKRTTYPLPEIIVQAPS
jgi:hypothetical protein